MAEFNTNYKPQDFNEFIELHQFTTEIEENSDTSFDEIAFENFDFSESVSPNNHVSLKEAHQAVILKDQNHTLESSISIAVQTIRNEENIDIEKYKSLTSAAKIESSISIKSHFAETIGEVEIQTKNKFEALLADAVFHFKESSDEHPIAIIAGNQIMIGRAVKAFKNLIELKEKEEETEYALVHQDTGHIFLSEEQTKKFPDIHKFTVKADEEIDEKLRSVFADQKFQPQIAVISNEKYTEFRALAVQYILRKAEIYVKTKNEEGKASRKSTEESGIVGPTTAEAKKASKKEIPGDKTKAIETLIIKDQIQRDISHQTRRQQKIQDEHRRQKEEVATQERKQVKKKHEAVTREIESEKIRKEWKEE